MVSFDFTNGPDHDICVVGQKEGKAITIVNAFERDQAKAMFNLLTNTDHLEKPWIEDHEDVVCPYCGNHFKDEIFFMCVTEEHHLPNYCPDCGKKIKKKTEEKK